jgi:uncharacterized protein (TIGR02246 family)
MMTSSIDATNALGPDAREVAALYQQLMDGWNSGSAEAFAAPFAEEFDFIAFDGVRFRRRDELIRFHEPLFRTHLASTRLVGAVTDVRFLGDAAAVFHAYGGMIRKGKTQPALERNSIQTIVAVKGDGRWQIVAFQNTRVRPIGENALGAMLWLLSDWLWKWCLPKSVRHARLVTGESQSSG